MRPIGASYFWRAGDERAAADLQEIAAAWQALPASVRACLNRQIERDLPDTEGAAIVEVDVHELDADEADIVGECLAFIMLSTHHMCAASYVPRPSDALLHLTRGPPAGRFSSVRGRRV